MSEQYKTYQILVKKGHRMHKYFQTMCENSKNMYNVTNFYVRQVYTTLTSEKDLHPLQKEVLHTLQQNIDKMNDNQLLAYQKKVKKEQLKSKEKRKPIKCNLFEIPIKEKPYVDYNFLDSLFKIISQSDYRSLPVQSSQWIMKQVFQDWKSFQQSSKDYKKNPNKYKTRPNIPRYSKSTQKEVLFTNQDCVIKEQKYLKFPLTKERLNIGKLGFAEGKLKQVRVVPKYNHYVVELVVNVPSEQLKEDNGCYMSIDLGVDNLATLVTNTGRTPILVKGKSVKSINQYYNKLKARYYGILRQGKKQNEGQFTSKRLERLSQKRFYKIKDVFHKASFHIVKIAVEENVSKIYIGKNQGWKQQINIGKRNNQPFTSIPHSMLIDMITYKAAICGIVVETVEESYTSKASFLDNDTIPTYKQGETYTFSGKRVKRGLYRSKNGVLINADVNGAANILRKAVPNAFAKGIEVLFVSTPTTLSVR